MRDGTDADAAPPRRLCLRGDRDPDAVDYTAAAYAAFARCARAGAPIVRSTDLTDEL